MRNKRLQSKLLQHADKGTMFHYMDSFNRGALSDPLLVRTSKHKFQWGYIVTAGLGILALVGLGQCF